MDENTVSSTVSDEFNDAELTGPEVPEVLEPAESADYSESGDAEALAALEAVEVGEDESKAAEKADSESVVPVKEPTKGDMERARLAAAGVVGGACFVAEIVASPVPLEIPDDARVRVRDDLAPVLAKYEMGAPGWLERWKEEVNLFKTLATVGFGVYAGYKESKAKLEEKPRVRVVAGESYAQS